MTQVTRPSTRQQNLSSFVTDAAYRCDNANCQRYSVVNWFSSFDPTATYRDGEPSEYDKAVWSPPAARKPTYEDVPPAIAEAAREAWGCHARGAYIASSAVARSVIEAAAKQMEVTVRGIEAKINELAARNLIWGSLLESAHVLRQFGNDAAHGDIASPPSPEEAEDVLVILDELLNQLYTSPARTQRLRASREARRAAP